MVLKEKAIGREFVAGPAAPRLGLGLPAALALPLLALAVYLVLYMSDLWHLGPIELAARVVYAPMPHLAFAAIISFGLSWYAAARPPAVLAAAAVLFVLPSLAAIGQSAATQQLIESVPRSVWPLLLPAVMFTASVLSSAAVMLAVGAVAPALRKWSYWLIALILWPLAAFAILLPVQAALIAIWQLDQSSMPHMYFAALLIKHCVIFAFIGYWFDRDNRRGKAISLAF